MSASKWITDVYDLGLLGTGATLVARLLEFPSLHLYLTNVVVNGIPTYVQFFPGLDSWTGLLATGTPSSDPFPYGLDVNPPD